MISAFLTKINANPRLRSCVWSRLRATSSAISDTTGINTQLQSEWELAKPYESVPRPSKLSLLTGYFPGGPYHGKTVNEVYNLMRQNLGDIYVVPGVFGKKDFVHTFNPGDFQKVFRTEGVYPVRRGIDIIQYFRKVHRPEVFTEAAGLVAEQGHKWSTFRSTVNPVMMNPKTFKLYAPKLNLLAEQFIKRIKVIRDSSTFEVPPNFEEELNFLTMETVGVIALDKHLGLIDGSVSNVEIKEFISNIKDFFELLRDLEMRPSLWKIVATPTYKQFMHTMGVITDMSIQYVEEAKERLIRNEELGITKPESEQSVLERLIKTSPAVASVMAMETILAGVDTTTSALAGCLINLAKNPTKQQKLREEILEILPEKSTPLTVEKMSNLPYLRACIKENLRLYPVTMANFRATGADVVLSGYRIPKDIDIIMPHQDLLRDEKNFARANEFWPERWLRGDAGKDENGRTLKTNNPFVFLPFGFGPRMCIGKRIVDLELEVYLAKLVRNFHIGFDYSTEGIFKAHMINVPGKPLQFKFIDLKK